MNTVKKIIILAIFGLIVFSIGFTEKPDEKPPAKKDKVSITLKVELRIDSVTKNK